MSSSTRKRKATASSGSVGVLQPILPVSQLNVFSRLPIQVSIESQRTETFVPYTVSNAQSVICFKIPGNEQFLSPEILVQLELKIVNGDGSDLANDAGVAPTENFGHSLFSDIELTLNGTTIAGKNSFYMYKSYFENVFFTTAEFKTSYLDGPTMFYRSTSGVFDSFNVAQNLGYKARKEEFQGSKVITLLFPLHIDILQQEKLLPPQVTVGLNFYPNSEAFRVRSDVTAANRNQKVVFESFKLLANRITLNAALHLRIMSAWRDQPMRYPIRRLVVHQFEKLAGTYVINQNIIQNGLLPSTVYLAIIRTARVLGSYTRNPYKINLSGLRSAKLVANGTEYPNVPYSFNLDERKVTREFVSLNQITGVRASGINLRDYMQGYGLLAFDLRRDQTTGVPGAPRTGSLMLHLNYETALDEVTSYIVLQEFTDSSIYISSSLDVSTDFTLNA